MELPTVCEAARPISCSDGSGAVICGVVANDLEAADVVLEGDAEGLVMNTRTDPSTIAGFCCGSALPVIDAVPEDGKAHYTACPVWRAGREADWERRDRVAVGDHRGSLVPDFLEAG